MKDSYVMHASGNGRRPPKKNVGAFAKAKRATQLGRTGYAIKNAQSAIDRLRTDNAGHPAANLIDALSISEDVKRACIDEGGCSMAAAVLALAYCGQLTRILEANPAHVTALGTALAERGADQGTSDSVFRRVAELEAVAVKIEPHDTASDLDIQVQKLAATAAVNGAKITANHLSAESEDVGHLFVTYRFDPKFESAWELAVGDRSHSGGGATGGGIRFLKESLACATWSRAVDVAAGAEASEEEMLAWRAANARVQLWGLAVCDETKRSEYLNATGMGVPKCEGALRALAEKWGVTIDTAPVTVDESDLEEAIRNFATADSNGRTSIVTKSLAEMRADALTCLAMSKAGSGANGAPSTPGSGSVPSDDRIAAAAATRS